MIESAGPFARLAAMKAEAEARAAASSPSPMQPPAKAAAPPVAAVAGPAPVGEAQPAIDVCGLSFSYPGLGEAGWAQGRYTP